MISHNNNFKELDKKPYYYKSSSNNTLTFGCIIVYVTCRDILSWGYIGGSPGKTSQKLHMCFEIMVIHQTTSILQRQGTHFKRAVLSRTDQTCHTILGADYWTTHITWEIKERRSYSDNHKTIQNTIQHCNKLPKR